MDKLTDMPALLIAGYLCWQDVLAVEAACRQLRKDYSKDELWRQIYLRDYGGGVALDESCYRRSYLTRRCYEQGWRRPHACSLAAARMTVPYTMMSSAWYANDRWLVSYDHERFIFNVFSDRRTTNPAQLRFLFSSGHDTQLLDVESPSCVALQKIGLFVPFTAIELYDLVQARRTSRLELYGNPHVIVNLSPPPNVLRSASWRRQHKGVKVFLVIHTFQLAATKDADSSMSDLPWIDVTLYTREAQPQVVRRTRLAEDMSKTGRCIDIWYDKANTPDKLIVHYEKHVVLWRLHDECADTAVRLPKYSLLRFMPTSLQLPGNGDPIISFATVGQDFKPEELELASAAEDRLVALRRYSVTSTHAYCCSALLPRIDHNTTHIVSHLYTLFVLTTDMHILLLNYDWHAPGCQSGAQYTTTATMTAASPPSRRGSRDLEAHGRLNLAGWDEAALQRLIGSIDLYELLSGEGSRARKTSREVSRWCNETHVKLMWLSPCGTDLWLVLAHKANTTAYRLSMGHYTHLMSLRSQFSKRKRAAWDV
ncbi:hypothetical protein RI367_002340 [Sorochytrium milnesiophthora]